MKITFVVPSLFLGGAEKQVRQLNNHLNSSTKINSKIFDCLTENPKKYDVLCGKVNSKLHRHLLRFKNSFHLYSKLRELDTHTLVFFNINFIVVAILLSTKKNVVFSIRENRDDYFRGWKWFLLKRIKYLFSNSQTVCKRVNAAGVRCKFIPNVIEHIENVKNGNALKENVLIVSNVEPHKNIHLVIEAIEGTQLPLVVCGKISNETYLNHCKELATKLSVNLVFKGFLSPEDVKEQFQCALFLVHASELEGTSNAIIEAAINRCLVLASDIPENIEVIGNSELLFSTGSVTELKEKIELVIKNEIDVSGNINKNFTRVKKLYSSKNYEVFTNWLQGSES